MTYDIHGSWDGNTAHHSPLYGPDGSVSLFKAFLILSTKRDSRSYELFIFRRQLLLTATSQEESHRKNLTWDWPLMVAVPAQLVHIQARTASWLIMKFVSFNVRAAGPRLMTRLSKYQSQAEAVDGSITTTFVV